MISYPHKRVFGLVGLPRAGKDVVANFLQETRNFATFAFADKIKEEFGISKEEFEMAKVSGKINELRKALWEFSANKKAKDKLYFIKKVMDEAVEIPGSAIIADIRTMDELNTFVSYINSNKHKARIYYVEKWGEAAPDVDNSGLIKDTEIPLDYMLKLKEIDQVRNIVNPNNGLYNFMLELEEFFFTEDISDLVDLKTDFTTRRSILNYVSQFKIVRAT